MHRLHDLRAIPALCMWTTLPYVVVVLGAACAFMALVLLVAR